MVPPSSSPDRWREVIRWRVLVTASLMLLWGLAIEGRLVHLQVFRHADLVERAARQQSRSIETHPKRGEILDREGRVLAYSVDADTVVSVPVQVDDPVEATRQLCDVLECDEVQRDRLQTRLGEDRLFAYVQRRVSVDASRRIRALDLEGKEIVEEAEGLRAVCLQHEYDHLDGILFIDRISRLKRGLYVGKRKKQLAEESED